MSGARFTGGVGCSNAVVLDVSVVICFYAAILPLFVFAVKLLKNGSCAKAGKCSKIATGSLPVPLITANGIGPSYSGQS